MRMRAGDSQREQGMYINDMFVHMRYVMFEAFFWGEDAANGYGL